MEWKSLYVKGLEFMEFKLIKIARNERISINQPNSYSQRRAENVMVPIIVKSCLYGPYTCVRAVKRKMANEPPVRLYTRLARQVVKEWECQDF